MAKLITLHEAAKMLGITPEKLTEMRSHNEISGYRDGSTWKFKEQEIERVAQQLGGSALDAAGSDSQESIELELDDLADDGDEESILVSEKELGKSEDTTSSTIIGKPDPVGSDIGSEISLGDVDEDESELRLAGSSSGLGSSADVLDAETSSGPSDTANLGGEDGSELKLEASGDSFDFDLDDSEVSLDVGSEVSLDGPSKASSSGFGSAIDLDLDDDELVLGSGSDVTAGTGDSGINLSSPSDSGLSLDEPLDIQAGSAIDSLELGEDDMIVLDDETEAEVPTDLQADDDFLLTPVEEEPNDDSSGSQEIDLDSSEFDESAATILAKNASPMEEIEEVSFETVDGEGDDFLEVDTGGASSRAPASGDAQFAGPAAMRSAEPQYSIYNVVALFAIVLVLGLTGIMMLDLINNIWSWEKNYSFNSWMMDTILGMLGSSS